MNPVMARGSESNKQYPVLLRDVARERSSTGGVAVAVRRSMTFLRDELDNDVGHERG